MFAASVYRLIAHADWLAAKALGGGADLPWSDDDRRDGFLHLSARDQVVETARRHYADVSDLWVLELDAAALGERLRWEPSRGGALFPHCHGPAPVDAVTDARRFDPGGFA
jgi:uncharacterized protein (DUF952 family)